MANNVRKFNASWSIANWVFTIIISGIVFVGFPGLIYHRIVSGAFDNEASTLFLFVGGLVPAIFLVALLFAPMRYTVTDSEVIINRLGPNLVIPIRDAADIRRIQRKELGFLPMRVFGVGGFCGSYGYFWNLRLGLFKGYITNTRTLIFIKYSGNKKILISLDRPEEFLNAVAQARNR